jgi:hypothetical protein
MHKQINTNKFVFFCAKCNVKVFKLFIQSQPMYEVLIDMSQLFNELQIVIEMDDKSKNALHLLSI